MLFNFLTLLILQSILLNAKVGNPFNVYRYYNPGTGDHFYTQNAAEIGTTTSGQKGKHGYKSEGVGFQLENDKATEFFYRYYNAKTGDHFYTTNAGEIGTTTPGATGKHGYKSEGFVGKCYKNKRYGYLVPLFRYYNAKNGDHFYTTNAVEIGTTTAGQMGKHGYRSEGVTCYVIPNKHKPKKTPKPTRNPTLRPTRRPTRKPTRKPTRPTVSPTDAPTKPTANPTETPTKKPTDNPTKKPTNNPTQSPTDNPTKKPTDNPTKKPTDNPTKKPTDNPTQKPTISPTAKPTLARNPIVTWSESFQQHEKTYRNSKQCLTWLEYIKNMPLNGVKKLRVYGSRNMVGYKCEDTTKVNEIVRLLKTCSGGSRLCGTVECEGKFWDVGSCTNQGEHLNELNVDSFKGTCQCTNDFGWISRPCIGNQNWGGMDQGQQCWVGSPSQTLNMDYTYTPGVNAENMENNIDNTNNVNYVEISYKSFIIMIFIIGCFVGIFAIKSLTWVFKNVKNMDKSHKYAKITITSSEENELSDNHDMGVSSEDEKISNL